jgi:hypothetical protein
MCDPKPLRTRLNRSIALMALAVGFVVVAATASGSLLSAMSSPLLMLVAGACSLAAMATLWGARAELDVFCHCVGAECAGKGPHVKWNLAAIQLVLGVETAACFAAAAHAWVPALAQPAMWIVMVAVVVQFGLFNSALGFVAGLVDCHFQDKEPA